MKRKILLGFAAMAMASFSVPVMAEEAETQTEAVTVTTDLPSAEAANGKFALSGYDFYTYQDKEYVIIIADYENTTSENVYPTNQFTEKVFQDGVQLELGTTDYGWTQERGMECDSSSTELQPGGKLHYMFAYELKSQSDLTFEVKEFLGDETLISYAIPYGGDATAPSNEDYKAMYEELLEKYEALQAEYDALKEE